MYKIPQEGSTRLCPNCCRFMQVDNQGNFYTHKKFHTDINCSIGIKIYSCPQCLSGNLSEILENEITTWKCDSCTWESTKACLD